MLVLDESYKTERPYNDLWNLSQILSYLIIPLSLDVYWRKDLFVVRVI